MKKSNTHSTILNNKKPNTRYSKKTTLGKNDNKEGHNS